MGTHAIKKCVMDTHSVKKYTREYFYSIFIKILKVSWLSESSYIKKSICEVDVRFAAITALHKQNKNIKYQYL